MTIKRKLGDYPFKDKPATNATIWVFGYVAYLGAIFVWTPYVFGASAFAFFSFCLWTISNSIWKEWKPKP